MDGDGGIGELRRPFSTLYFSFLSLKSNANGVQHFRGPFIYLSNIRALSALVCYHFSCFDYNTTYFKRFRTGAIWQHFPGV